MGIGTKNLYLVKVMFPLWVESTATYDRFSFEINAFMQNICNEGNRKCTKFLTTFSRADSCLSI
jgi:hypothetical protein